MIGSAFEPMNALILGDKSLARMWRRRSPGRLSATIRAAVMPLDSSGRATIRAITHAIGGRHPLTSCCLTERLLRTATFDTNDLVRSASVTVHFEAYRYEKIGRVTTNQFSLFPSSSRLSAPRFASRAREE